MEKKLCTSAFIVLKEGSALWVQFFTPCAYISQDDFTRVGAVVLITLFYVNGGNELVKIRVLGSLQVDSCSLIGQVSHDSRPAKMPLHAELPA